MLCVYIVCLCLLLVFTSCCLSRPLPHPPQSSSSFGLPQSSDLPFVGVPLRPLLSVAPGPGQASLPGALSLPECLPLHSASPPAVGGGTSEWAGTVGAIEATWGVGDFEVV